VTSLRYSSNDNLAAWRALPPLEGTNLIASAKPDATVLAVHPRLKTKSGKPMPVIVAGDYGKGRSIAFTTDSLWRYGFVAAGHNGDDGRQYTKLWENAIRWLIQDPDLRNLHVDSDAVEYVPGAPVRVAVRLLGRDYQPLPNGEVTLTVTRGADPAKAAPVSTQKLTVGEDGTQTVELGSLGPGVYRVIGKATIAGRVVDANDIFLVREGGSELDRPVGDRATLEAIAAATHGEALGPIDSLPARLAFDPPRIIRVDRRTDVELWSRPGLLILVVGLLGLEWLLRQRSGYL
jgi:Putative glutamine amidotransferase